MKNSKTISETAVLTVLNESLQIFQKSIDLRLNATTPESEMAQVDDPAKDSVYYLQSLHAESSALIGALKKASMFQCHIEQPEALDNQDPSQETINLIKAMLKHFTLCVQPLLQPHKNLNAFEILDMVQYEQMQWIENYAEDEVKYSAMRCKDLTELFEDAFGPAQDDEN